MKKTSLFLAGFFIFSGFCFSQDASDAKSDPVLKAMVEELDRSYKKLKNAEKAPLYFLQYEVFDKSSYWVSSNLGAIIDEGDNLSKTLTVDARVGSHKLDNSHEIKGKESRSRGANSKNIGSIRIPLSDENAIKAKIWELTDKAYKNALDKYLKVVMNKKVTAKEEDKSGDFSLNKKVNVFYQRVNPSQIDKDKVTYRVIDGEAGSAPLDTTERLIGTALIGPPCDSAPLCVVVDINDISENFMSTTLDLVLLPQSSPSHLNRLLVSSRSASRTSRSFVHFNLYRHRTCF